MKIEMLKIERYVILIGCMFLVFIKNILATTFVPVPLEEQLRESDAIIQGIFQGSSTKREKDGRIVTVLSFKLEKVAGIPSGKLTTPHDFKVYVPGGTWQGLTYKTVGVPKFEKGIEVILLIKKYKGGYFPTNLALAKYNIVRMDGITYISSSVFSNHKKLGMIAYSDLEEHVLNSFGREFSTIHDNKFVYKSNRKKIIRGRLPAGIRKKENRIHDVSSIENSIERSSNGGGTLLILFILALIATYMVKRRT